jgi:putative inorganic carbon (hco3(-)) transporter
VAYPLLITTIIVFFIRPAEWIPELNYSWNMMLNGVALLMFAQMAGKPASFNADRITKLLFAFFFFTIVSNITNRQFSSISGNLMANLTTIIICVLAQSAINTGKQAENFILVVIWLALFICYQCFLQATQGEAWGGLKPMSRSDTNDAEGNPIETVQVIWYGVLGDPNDLGMFLVAFLPFILNRVVYQDIGLIKKSFWVLVAAVLVYTVVLTNSRGTLLAFIAGLGSFFIIKTRSLIGLIAAAVLGIVVLMMGSSRSMSAGDESAMGRIEAWVLAINLFVRNPLSGVGAGHFTDYHHLTTHNSYVLAFVENGFFGFVCYLAMFIVPVYTGVKVAYNTEDRRRSTELISLVCGLLSIALAMFFITRTYALIPFLYIVTITAYMRVYCPAFYDDAIGKLSLIKLSGYSAGFIVFVFIFNKLTLAIL